MVDIEKGLVGLSDRGRVIGESHPRARLTDEQVELIRDLWEEGFVSYRTLSRIFKTPRSTIQDICQYRRRYAVPAYFVKRKGRRL